MSRTDSRSDLMALALRLRIWPAADGADGRSSSYIESLMQEAADAFDRLAASQPDREAVARIIDPVAFNMRPEMYGLKSQDELEAKTLAGPARNIARTKADAILSLLSGAGSGADTKSDGGCNCSWGCVEADNCRRKLGPLPDWKQDQSETSRIKPRPSDPSPGHEVKPAPIADSSEAGRGGSQALREVVVKYLHDGRLQTFEDRERFRKEARAALSAPVGEPVASLNASIDSFALAQARRIVEENAIPFATISGGYHRLDLPTAAYKALKEALYPHPPAPAVGADVREALANAIEALRPFARAAENIPGNLPDDLWTHCASYRFDMPEETYQRLKDAGVPVLDKTMNLSLWIDGHPLGDFRRAKAAYDVLSALTRPLGGFVQGSIADGRQCNEQSAPQPSLRTSPELLAALGRAKAHVMTPAERYEQRRSFTRGMCPSNRDYAEWCTEVDKLLPPLPAVAETDAVAPENAGLLGGASSAPDHTTMIIPCSRCSGEGSLYASRYGGNDPDVWRTGKCDACDGSGNEVCSSRGCDEPAVAFNDDGDALCEDCLSEWTIAGNESEGHYP